MSMDASAFLYNAGSHLKYLEIAYTFLIEAYQKQLKDKYQARNNNENKIRDDLVLIAKTKRDSNFPFRWITEYPDIENNNRIDIDLATPQSLIDETTALKIECKIVGEDKYIDNKKSFYRKDSPTNGIMSFITGKYSSKMSLAGMIGFIKDGKIDNKIRNIKTRLENHIDIKTSQNLETYPLKEKFNYSYHSIHERYSNLDKISIYHLFFNYSLVL